VATHWALSALVPNLLAANESIPDESCNQAVCRATLGAVSFSVDLQLIRSLKRQLPLPVFVETGTFQGDTTARVANLFEKVYTVELSKQIFDSTSKRLASFANVKMIHASSPDAIRSLADELSQRSVLYWLDAHWCGGATAGQVSECPLIGELSAIGALNDDSVVLIDDARLFIAPPPRPHNVREWPGLLEAVDRLRGLSNRHRLWIINDVFIFVPERVEPDIVEYGRTHGIDLHQVFRAATDASTVMPERDAAITQLGRVAGGEGPHAGTTPNAITIQSGFNAAFLSSIRPERIFAFHLRRLGIERLLDIGGNTGQFARKMRSLGYGGLIYSVEPQSAAYKQLLGQSRADLRWLPLVRQGVGAEKGFFELNLSENSWSSSILEVHPNHVRAERTTRFVGKERIFLNKTSDLLRTEFMTEIEALKIDVQGYEAKVIEGYLPLIDHVRLLLLELSMVECYKGAPDLFSLDKLLVERLGFSRVSLEPSYYDDVNGVVQQYDGIYFRPDRAPRRANALGVTVSAVVTSMESAPRRTGEGGADIGADWLAFCAASWISTAPRVVSISETPPAVKGIEWVQAPKKPSIAELFRAMEQETDQHVLFINAENALTEEMKRLFPQLNPIAIHYGNRLNVEADPSTPGALVEKGLHHWGFDYFLLPPGFVRLINRESLIPETFRVGEPWWDYPIPLIALAMGFPIKKLGLEKPLALHYVDHRTYPHDLWIENGQRFLDCARRLREHPKCHAEGLLASLLAPAQDVEQSLHRAARIICDELP
jgi:FkbM family methyltransferase